MENIKSSATATLYSVAQSFTTLESQLQDAKAQTNTLHATFDAYEKGYGQMMLQPTTHAHLLCEALQLQIDNPTSLDQVLHHFHKYLYDHDLYDSTTQRINLNPILQTTFQTSNQHVHYFTLFRQVPRLFTQIQDVPHVA